MLVFAPRQDFAGRDVERGEQIERAIPDVVVGPPFGLANVQGQDRLGPLERLNLRLLVEGEHHRVVRRIHIQADDIPNLIDELGVGRHLERLRDVRFEPKRPPDAADHRVTHPGLRCHRPRAPMGLALRRRLQRLNDHRFDRLVGDRPWRADARLVIQAVEPPLNEACPPFTHRRIGGPMATRHHGIGDCVRTRQHEPSAKRERAIDVGPLRQPNQFPPLDLRHHQCDFRTSDHGHGVMRSRHGSICKTIRFQGTRVLLYLAVGDTYAGLGTETINGVLAGTTSVLACGFLLKILATSITLETGGSGGIVTPIFFIGATSGAALAPLFGMPTTFLAAVGLVAMLAAAANTPIAAAVMAMELLPGPVGVYAALAAATAFLMVGHRSVYASQKIGLSKSAGLDVQLGGPIGDVSRASVRIRKGSLTERVHQFGRAPSSHTDSDPDDSR
jgi:Voltage gated chloride channel